METFLWIIAGGVVGWIGYTSFHLNEARGRNVSMILGGVGALIGAKAIAPLFMDAPAQGFNTGGMFFAVVAAAGALALANLAASRWDI